MNKNLFKLYLIALLGIFIDQVSKLLVHNSMDLYSTIIVFDDWFQLHYVLNPGMAFGWKFDFEYGKLFLTSFRIIAAIGIAYFIYYHHKKQSTSWGFLACIALILGGTVGNLIDSIFYGVFIEGNVIEDSFTPWFHGRVIDMLYFPLFEGNLPAWLPFWGGKYFVFFSPVFNIADSIIFIGITSILLFHREALKSLESRPSEAKKEEITQE